MKTYTLYSLFFMKNIIRLFFISLMIGYLFILFWWQAYPLNHTRTLWMPISFFLMYSTFLITVYFFRLQYEKIKLDPTSFYYYKQRFVRSQVVFYHVEKQNQKIRLLFFNAGENKTFLFSTFLQKKRYQRFLNELKLQENPESEAI